MAHESGDAPVASRPEGQVQDTLEAIAVANMIVRTVHMVCAMAEVLE